MSQETVPNSPVVGDEGDDDSLGQVQQYVTFTVGKEVFAVEMLPVQEIIRVPEVVRVPLTPPALNGLANLRGNVLPIICLRTLFQLEPREADDATRAIVLNLGQPLGFVVDRVASVIMVEDEQIEPVSNVQTTIDTQLLTGLLKQVGGHELVMIIDFASLIRDSFSENSLLQRMTNSAGPMALLGDEAEDEASDELQLVSFSVAGQEYAIAIEDVQEIVQVPADIVSVPKSASHVRGVMTLRQRLLPLVSLREMFQLPGQATDERSRILVVSLSGVSVGIILDSVNEVLRVPANLLEAMPPMLARDQAMAEITGLCRLQEGKRLVSVVSAERLLNHQAVQKALTTTTKEPGMDEELLDQAENDDEEQLVVFRLGNEEYGVPIDSVQEIVRVPENLTHVPKAPPFVEGVMNLRGVVLPVIDQRRRFGLPRIEANDRQRIMVFVIKNLRTGFIVDSVAEVLKISRTLIEPAPVLSSEQQRLFGRVANLPAQKRMIQLVEPRQILADRELDALSSVA
ncbi:chemotaxis protein CheW [Halomonas sp. McH1-25]|uniref:chemotaxis protein CheW n=1 Tax=unclassified Halomonas TaxID=2609666 RepID=UPI001EF58B34|nr:MULTISPECIES: chemotaxis protein CheW [unclassified Halomonas]MCG7601112.1 chemotaxis protein CheW [Halomonas sp. McH1-25]MCP1342982.1 chemotaxis protein CheW [Halomonas sp. FL8]MCP1360834.1 chemotaxis protein CheW [Halomonas sp. BBD45]MCP1364432.1 chemotaxis protein CheW [Halomonas sp. BBD48]